ncbi:MAG: YjbH domain-containing protein [Syntrophales bacterium]
MPKAGVSLIRQKGFMNISFRMALHCGLLCLLLLSGVSWSAAGEFHNALSLQGFTGLLNTPNAEVTDEGKAYLLYSNQKESHWRDRARREENYMFSVGFFSFAEIGGRYTEAPGKARDLTANFKVKLPFIPRGAYLPQVAFGMQDVGGGLKYLQTKYVVATKDLWRFRFSLGYGTGPDRMDGVFGGLELKAFDWLYLIGEHDTREKNLGIRLVTPSLFGLPVNLHATAKTSLDYRAGHMEYGIGLQVPLGLDERKNNTPAEARNRQNAAEQAADEAEADEEDAESAEADAAENGDAPAASGPAQFVRLPAAEEAPGNVASGTESPALSDGDGGMWALRESIVVEGFQNVRVGADPDKTLLVVEYENSRYSHNELDGLGVVARLAAETVSPDFEMIQLIMKKKDISVFQISFPLPDFKDFLNYPEKLPQFNAGVEITSDVRIDETVRFIDGDAGANPSWLNSELIVYPGVKTFIGAEVSVFDYLLSIKPDYYLNVWKGAVLNARWDIPVSWSENFDDGKVYRNGRDNSKLERVMLFQAVKATPHLMLNFGAGQVLKDTYGTVNELVWTPGGGNHRFSLKHAYLNSSETQAAYQGNSAYLGSYRYYFGPLDLYLEGTAGQFLDQDRGFTCELKRFFGDTSFSLYYKNSRTEGKPYSPSEHVQMAGAQISIPLTPRREMKPIAKVQVKGSNEWSYAQETKIVTPGFSNSVDTSIGLDPQMVYNLERIFYNRDRLSEDYVRQHLLRLRK